jgi:GNAT superfamily N-acetyltransferase
MKVRLSDPADQFALKPLFLHQRQHRHPCASLSVVAQDALEDQQSTIDVIDLFGGVLMVCEDASGGLVGMATLTLTGSYPVPADECAMRLRVTQDTEAKPAQLMSVWVEPGHRRSGAGTRLVGAVINWARERGVTQVLLTHDPTAAYLGTFYRHLGFEPC